MKNANCAVYSQERGRCQVGVFWCCGKKLSYRRQRYVNCYCVDILNVTVIRHCIVPLKTVVLSGMADKRSLGVPTCFFCMVSILEVGHFGLNVLAGFRPGPCWDQSLIKHESYGLKCASSLSVRNETKFQCLCELFPFS